MKTIQKLIDLIVLLLTGKGDAATPAIDGGAVSHAGQGRDKYGK